MNRLISLSIFLALAIIVWWSITANYNVDNRLQQAKSNQYIELFMNEFEITAMDDSGAPSYRLNGLHLQRFNDSDDSQIKQPVFQILQANNQWQVTAESATVNDKNETIHLTNNVVMQQKNIEPAVTIRTQSLLVHIDKQIVQTPALVNITKGNSHLKSNGMIYNNITSELELSSNVNGHYLPYD